jgi:hypothetical protein
VAGFFHLQPLSGKAVELGKKHPTIGFWKCYCRLRRKRVECNHKRLYMAFLMVPSNIKEKLHHYIDTADEKKLQAIYTTLEEEIGGEYFYTQDEIRMFYDRREKYLNCKTKSYSVDEVHRLIRKNHKNGL